MGLQTVFVAVTRRPTLDRRDNTGVLISGAAATHREAVDVARAHCDEKYSVCHVIRCAVDGDCLCVYSADYLIGSRPTQVADNEALIAGDVVPRVERCAEAFRAYLDTLA